MPGDPPEDGDDSDVERTKAALRRLARSDDRVVERAEAAVADLGAAVEFVGAGGIADLERALETAGDPDRRRRAERALAAFRRYRAAAAGELRPEHFQPGRDTDLRRRDEAPAE